MDPTTGRSKGFGFLEYITHESAKKALGINGIPIGGRQLKVGLATSSSSNSENGKGEGDRGGDGSDRLGELDEVGRGGLKMNQERRHKLMLQLAGDTSVISSGLKGSELPTRVIEIKNMFDRNEESGDTWVEELVEEVKEECRSRFGKVLEVKVEEMSEGCVYVVFEEREAAIRARGLLRGRWFGGRLLGCGFVEEEGYRGKYGDLLSAS